MERTRVKSSNVHSIGYTPGEGMEVQFKDENGPVYLYRTVSAAEHKAAMEAPSIGAHLATHIKSKHVGERID